MKTIIKILDESTARLSAILYRQFPANGDSSRVPDKKSKEDLDDAQQMLLHLLYTLNDREHHIPILSETSNI